MKPPLSCALTKALLVPFRQRGMKRVFHGECCQGFMLGFLLNRAVLGLLGALDEI